MMWKNAERNRWHTFFSLQYGVPSQQSARLVFGEPGLPLALSHTPIARYFLILIEPPLLIAD